MNNLGSDTHPLVTAVIPTRNRPELVCRAVLSALSQTYPKLEVVVVIDGPDPSTLQALKGLNKPMLRVVALEENVGGSEARNIGVREAHGDWIAFLDDDDEWLPEKLERQMPALMRSQHKWPICTCRTIRRRTGCDTVIPRRVPEHDEPLSEYLLCRKHLRHGECNIQTSTLVVPKSLLVNSPFTPKLPRYQDWDWLLRVAKLEGFGIEWVWEPLTIYNLQAGLSRITWQSGWADSLQWARGNPFLTARAFSYFVAVQIAPRFSIFRDFRHLPGLVSDIFRYGQFEPRALLFGLLFAATPSSLRGRIVQRSLFTRGHAGAS
jgi:glycosyltransferase involved in cell wall biosynthesis